MAPNGQHLPLGVYEGEPPEEVPGLKATSVGGGLGAQAAAFATGLAGQAQGILDKLNPLD